MSSISRRDLLAGGASVLASAALPVPPALAAPASNGTGLYAAPFEEIVWNVTMRQIAKITFHADGTETVVWSPVEWSRI